MPLNNYKLLLLIPIILIILSQVSSVHGEGFTYAPQCTTIKGYAPGFQLLVSFSYKSSTGIQTSLSRANNFTNEPNLRPLGDFFSQAGFQTDGINEYVFTVGANYSNIVNQTIRVDVVSAGETVSTSYQWAIANEVELCFRVSTSKSPEDPNVVAQALNELQAADKKDTQNRIATVDAHVSDLRQDIVNTQAIAGAAFVSSLFVAVSYLRTRRR